jgi:hypothetical protein
MPLLTATRLKGHLTLSAVLSVACTHLVKRPLDCAPPPLPRGQSGIGWERDRVNGVSGKVVAPGSLVPPQTATVTFTVLANPPQSPERTYRANTDDTGQFRIDSIPPGRYLMRVRRLGYRSAHDTIQTMPDSGVVVTAVLARDFVRFDECGPNYQEVRVPWWKR